MALTQISTAGVKDDAVTAGKIPANAVGSSELADNAVDTAAIADDAVTAAKLASGVQTTINNNADNRVITGSGTASTLEGEANLTFDGSNLGINGDFVGSNNTTLYSSNGGSGVRAGIALSGSDQALKFYTVSGGSERLRIDSSGNVGIGTSSPSSFNADGRNLVVGTGSGGQGLSIYSANNNYGNIYFADGTSDGSYNAGGILYNHSSNFMRFDTAAGERMRIDSSGRISIGTTDVPGSGIQMDLRKSSDTTVYSATANQPNGLSIFNPSGVDGGFSGIQIGSTSSSGHYGSTVLKNVSVTTGYSSDFVVQTRHQGNYGERLRVRSEGGLCFNGDTAAANALDDYEEGAWSPQVHTQNGHTNATYNYQQGYYTKIGRVVHASGYVNWSGATNHNGYIYFNNFPFNSGSLSHNNAIGSVMLHSATFPTNYTDAVLYMGSNSPGTNLYYSKSGSGWAAGQNTNSGEIIFSITYIAT